MDFASISASVAGKSAPDDLGVCQKATGQIKLQLCEHPSHHFAAKALNDEPVGQLFIACDHGEVLLVSLCVMLQHPHGHGFCAARAYQRGICHGQFIVLRIGRQVRRCAPQDDRAVSVFAACDTDLARLGDRQGAEVDAALGELCACDGQAVHDCRGG